MTRPAPRKTRYQRRMAVEMREQPQAQEEKREPEKKAAPTTTRRKKETSGDGDR